MGGSDRGRRIFCVATPYYAIAVSIKRNSMTSSVHGPLAGPRARPDARARVPIMLYAGPRATVPIMHYPKLSSVGERHGEASSAATTAHTKTQAVGSQGMGTDSKTFSNHGVPVLKIQILQNLIMRHFRIEYRKGFWRERTNISTFRLTIFAFECCRRHLPTRLE